MELKVVQYKVEDGVATLTLNRPQRLNAWTGRMHTEYRWVLDQAEHDPAVRVMVVTGAGRAFCAGADARALEGHVAKGRYDPGTPAELAQPGYGVRAEFDADFAYHFGLLSLLSRLSMVPLRVLGSCLPAMLICASPRLAPSSLLPMAS